MEYNDSDYLMLSGIQHFAFCRRQWAIIHIENQWAENYRTADGRVMHDKAHDSAVSESRGELLIKRGMKIHSPSLGISGECDVVEFHRVQQGISLSGHTGLWLPYPIEYKRGSPKSNNADELQLCAEAMCLEEMLCTDITEGALFYGETRRRVPVEFAPELRNEVKSMLTEMHDLFERGHTPRVKATKACNACSLKELCLPKLMKKKSVRDYISAAMEDCP